MWLKSPVVVGLTCQKVAVFVAETTFSTAPIMSNIYHQTIY